MCDLCSNISPLIEIKKGPFKGGWYPEENETQIVSYEYDGHTHYATWDNAGGDTFLAGIGIDDINYCPVCGRKLTESEEQR